MYICIHENVGKWKIPVGKGVGGVNNVGGGGENSRTGTQAEKEKKKKTCTLKHDHFYARIISPSKNNFKVFSNIKKEKYYFIRLPKIFQ